MNSIRLLVLSLIALSAIASASPIINNDSQLIDVELINIGGDVYQAKMKASDVKYLLNSEDTDSINRFRLKCSKCIRGGLDKKK